MTNPEHAHATDNGRYYVHPVTGESWPSITNVLDTAVNKKALVPWAARVTAEHILRDKLPYYVRMSRTDLDGAVKEAKKQVTYVRDTAADLGSRVHAHAEAHVLGTAAEHDPEVEPFTHQLLKFFDHFGIDITQDVLAAEATVINRTYGYAGTGDLWLNLRVDPRTREPSREYYLWLVDYKTSVTKPVSITYPEQGLQLAALAHAETILLPDGTEIPPPAPIQGTAVVNIRPSSYALVPLPSDVEAAFEAFVHAVGETKYFHGLKDKPQPARAPKLRR